MQIYASNFKGWTTAGLAACHGFFGFSPSIRRKASRAVVEAVPLEELEVGGSELSGSSIESGPAKDEAPTSNPESSHADHTIDTVLDGTTPLGEATVSMRTDGLEPSAQRHSLYFWNFNSF